MASMRFLRFSSRVAAHASSGAITVSGSVAADVTRARRIRAFAKPRAAWPIRRTAGAYESAAITDRSDADSSFPTSAWPKRRKSGAELHFGHPDTKHEGAAVGQRT